ncbi:MAG: M48 family metalloprotease [Gammaproteobacteria bacterium]
MKGHVPVFGGGGPRTRDHGCRHPHGSGAAEKGRKVKGRHICVLALLVIGHVPCRAALFEELAELKRICDASLLTADECTERRREILAKHDGEAASWYCHYAGEDGLPNPFAHAETKAFSESASASSVVKEILDEAGLAPNFVVRPANVPNAAASARGGQRFIEYNPGFISQLKDGTRTNWAVYSVMAHEIGHHLQGHTLQAGGSRPALELEADEYSGFILARLGASLPQTQKAMRTFGSDDSRGTHPNTDDRLAAIKQGWERARNVISAPADDESPARDLPPVTPGPISPPPSQAYTASCVVNGEPIVIAANGSILSRVNGYSQVGQKIPSQSPNCVFEMFNGIGRYCVTQSGSVHFGSPAPVGFCQPCVGNLCN